MAEPHVDEIVRAWCERDRARAFLRSDHEVIESTLAVRAVILERLLAMTDGSDNAGDRDLLNAFAILGRLSGERGGSPTLCVAMIDGLVLALPRARGAATLEAWVAPARAAVAEAYALARREAAAAEANARWEYPGCAVGLADGMVAIAAGYPDDDRDALCEWAGRVANALALAGVRKVTVSGSAAAEAALADALDLAGVERVAGRPAPYRLLGRKK